MIAIPKAVTSAYIRLNAAAADLELSADDLRASTRRFRRLPASETWRSSEWSTGETACACFPGRGI
ncbi:hypothetical protein ACPA9J_09920 [Pseudomonas aeruginosa]